jgi:hypothetical protein
MAAISANFIADFTSFLRGTDAATDKLRDFEKEAGQVDKSLSKFGNDLPQNMQKAAKEIEPVEKNIGLMGKAAGLAESQFVKMFGAFTAASLVDKAVTSLISFGAAALESAGHVADLSDQTGLSTTAIQQMSYVADQTGSSLDTFTKAAQKLGINLSTGTKDTKRAVEDLGLSFETLRKQKPEDQFRVVMEALGKVTDAGDRNRLGNQLLGKSFQEMGAAAVSGYGDMAKSAHVAGEEQIRALDAAGDAWADLKSTLSTTVTSGLGTAWIEFNKFAQGFLDTADAIAAKLYKVSGGALGMPKNLVATGKTTTAAPEPPAKQPPHRDEEAEAAAEKKKAEAIKAANAERQTEIDLVKQLQGLNTVEAIEKEMKALNKFGKGFGPADAELKKFYADADTAARTLDRMGESARAEKIRAYADAMKLATTDTRGFGQMLALAVPGLTAAQAALANMATPLEPLAAGTEAFRKQLDQAIPGLTLFEAKAKQLKQTADDPGFLGGMTKGLDNFMRGMTGGKGLGGFMDKLGGSVVQGFGNILSGGLTSAINAGIGLVTKGIGKLWGSITQSEGKKTNDVRDEFIQKTFGTEDALRKLAFQAGATEKQVQAIFSANTVDKFQAAMSAVQGQMDSFTSEQEADAARLEAAISKYGFAIEELGPALQKQKLDEQAKDLIEDWRVLIEAGVDVGTVNEKMADSVNDFIKIAKKTGTEVPAAMRPMLQSMIDQGKLTDEAGNQIKDLQAAGVTFSETLTQGFDRVVKKLDQMLAKLGGVNDAIADIPDEVNVDVNVRTTGGGGGTIEPDPSSSIPGGLRLHTFNEGTHGRFLDFGQGTPAMLHGKERVVTEDEIGTTVGGVQAMVDAVYMLNTTLLRAMRENSLMTRDQIQLARA